MQYGRVLLTLLITALAYQLTVIALPLMNKPSDLALDEGIGLLALTAVGWIALVRLLWRRPR